MKTFNFQGEVDSSKSYFNRALILQSYDKALKLHGKSQSRDVIFLQKALFSFQPEMEVGEGGTTLRFLAFRISREPGVWKLKGTERLFSRPQSEITKVLNQLGVETKLHSDFLEIKSSGWKNPGEIFVDMSESSQFASGILLNAWQLPFDLQLKFSEKRVSDGYFEMTLQLVEKAGMKFQRVENGLKISAGQKISIPELRIEQDISSAFVVAALAASRGHCRLENFPKDSLQPDVIFVELFKKMNVPIRFEGSTLCVDRCEDMKPIEVSLKQAPDLFPVLCVLLRKAKGTSVIFDTPQLIHKESNRLAKTAELLSLMRVPHEVIPDGIRIHGPALHHIEFFEYDSDQDHRLAFAGALAKSMGYRMRIKHPEVVDKSFPGFWNLITGGPG